MTTTDQQEFVNNLTESVRKEIVAHIRDGKIPAEWDGHELRALLAEKFTSEAALSLSRNGSLCKRQRRYRQFRNTVITNNL